MLKNKNILLITEDRDCFISVIHNFYNANVKTSVLPALNVLGIKRFLMNGDTDLILIDCENVNSGYSKEISNLSACVKIPIVLITNNNLIDNFDIVSKNELMENINPFVMKYLNKDKNFIAKPTTTSVVIGNFEDGPLLNIQSTRQNVIMVKNSNDFKSLLNNILKLNIKNIYISEDNSVFDAKQLYNKMVSMSIFKGINFVILQKYNLKKLPNKIKELAI